MTRLLAFNKIFAKSENASVNASLRFGGQFIRTTLGHPSSPLWIAHWAGSYLLVVEQCMAIEQYPGTCMLTAQRT